MFTKIKKRDGRYTTFNCDKIKNAIDKAFISCKIKISDEKLERLCFTVVNELQNEFPDGKVPTVEKTQDIVEKVLMNSNYFDVAKRTY